MHADKTCGPVASHETGMLSMTEGCPALIQQDGRRFWLEMESIPQDLIDRDVDIHGIVHQQYLIVVERIRALS